MRGTVKWCKCWRVATSETGTQQSTRYFGARFCRHQSTVTASLYCTLSGTSSQCSSCDSPWSYLWLLVTRRAAAFSTRCCKTSVMYWGGTALQQSSRDMMKACTSVFEESMSNRPSNTLKPAETHTSLRRVYRGLDPTTVRVTDRQTDRQIIMKKRLIK